jgi:hypothetical protein
MALSGINILKQDGKLSRPLQSNDGISGLLFYTSGLDANVNTGNLKLTSDLDIKDILGITGTTVEAGATIAYHVEEYFRQSESTLYVNIKNSANVDFAEVLSMKDFANGEIRQVGIYDEADFATASITSLQAIAEQAEDEYEPLQITYSAPLVTGDTVEDLVDLKPNLSPRVSYTIGEDVTEASEAARLRTAGAVLVGDIGTVMGSVSKASVHENIGWVSKFNLVEGEFQDPGFIDGSKAADKSKALLNTLDGYAYIFLRKFVGSNGTYHSYSYTCAAETSDFQTIENNRTYDKAFRGIYLSLLPQVNSPLYVDNAGKLEASTVAFFTELTEGALKTMEDAGELSGYLVNIDPEQNVLSTSKIEITAKIQPVGVAKTIEVKLGFTLTV